MRLGPVGGSGAAGRINWATTGARPDRQAIMTNARRRRPTEPGGRGTGGVGVVAAQPRPRWGQFAPPRPGCGSTSAATSSSCRLCLARRSRAGASSRSSAENSAKAVAEEAARRVVTPEFFARHSVAELYRRGTGCPSGPPDPPDGAAARRQQTDIPSAGTARAGLRADRRAFAERPGRTGRCSTPRAHQQRDGVPHQLMVRSFRRNNLPDCSTCATSPRAPALIESIGISKGFGDRRRPRTRRPDRHRRTESRHQPPRMLSVLEGGNPAAPGSSRSIPLCRRPD